MTEQSVSYGVRTQIRWCCDEWHDGSSVNHLVPDELDPCYEGFGNGLHLALSSLQLLIGMGDTPTVAPAGYQVELELDDMVGNQINIDSWEKTWSPEEDPSLGFSLLEPVRLQAMFMAQGPFRLRVWLTHQLSDGDGDPLSVLVQSSSHLDVAQLGGHYVQPLPCPVLGGG